MNAKLKNVKTVAVVVVLIATASIGAAQGGDPSKNPNKSKTKASTTSSGSRKLETNPTLRRRRVTKTSTTSSGSRKSSRDRGLARERRRREEAEAEAAEARAAQARAEREDSEKKKIWLVAILRNRTASTIHYKVLKNGSWTRYELEPGKGLIYSLPNTDCICVKYDYKFEPGFQEKQIKLDVTVVLGHEPTRSEKDGARVNYFKKGEDGDLHIY